MKDAIENHDVHSFKDYIHNLKGASSYIAAGPLVQVTRRALKNYEDEEYIKMIAEYPSIIEHCIAVKKESAILIYEHAVRPAP